MKTIPLVFLFCGLLFSDAIAKEPEPFRELPAKEGYCRLYIFRVNQLAGVGIVPKLKIDGIELDKLPAGSAMALYIRPGTHEFETKIPLINFPIKGGKVQMIVPEVTELYFQYRTDLGTLSASQYALGARYSAGFVDPDPAFAQAESKKTRLRPVNPMVLLEAKR